MIIYKLVPSDDPIAFPEQFDKFKCVLLIERPVGRDFQLEVSRALVRNGCLYAMAWGRDCCCWHDSVDLANREQFEFGDIPDDQFVMTTWHEGDTLDEVIRFAKVVADSSYGGVALPDTLVLDFALQDRSELIKVMFERAE